MSWFKKNCRDEALADTIVYLERILSEKEQEEKKESEEGISIEPDIIKPTKLTD